MSLRKPTRNRISRTSGFSEANLNRTLAKQPDRYTATNWQRSRRRQSNLVANQIFPTIMKPLFVLVIQVH
ncbi:hypothetical protein CVT26_008108, partial [Gymnopilus dilepis]